MSLEDLRKQLSEYTIRPNLSRRCVGRRPGGFRARLSDSRFARRRPEDPRCLVLDEKVRVHVASTWRAKITTFIEDGSATGAAVVIGQRAQELEEPWRLRGCSPRDYQRDGPVLRGCFCLRRSDALAARGRGHSNQSGSQGLDGPRWDTVQQVPPLVQRAVPRNNRAVASLEREGSPLTLQGFIDFTAFRYGLMIDQAPSTAECTYWIGCGCERRR